MGCGAAVDGSLGRQPKEPGKRSREAAEQRRKVTSLTLVTPSNETMRIARNTIDEQSAKTSTMPAMTRALTLLDIRDLTEYLSTLTTRSEPK